MSRLIDENAIIKMLNTMDRYTSEELTLCDTDKTFPKNEVFIVDDVFEGLDELPSTLPEQKSGKWIYKKDLKQFFCSECGFPSLTYDDVYIYLMDLPNYCEDCGADMRKGAGRRTDDR